MIEKTFVAGSQFMPAVVLTDSAGNIINAANPLQTASPDVTASGVISTQNLNGSTGAADSDATAVAAGDVILDIDWL